MVIACCGCNKKLTRVNKNSLEFVTKLYCSLECLSAFSLVHLQQCCQCNSLVDDQSRIKYCTRFGTKVEQFCSFICLENYKKSNAFCTLCRQKLGVIIISRETKFCSLFCASRYNGRGINQKHFDNRNVCTICRMVGVHHYEVLKGPSSEFLCSEKCVKSHNLLHHDNEKAIRTACSLCGCLLIKCKVNFFLGGWIIGFCSEQCSSIYLTVNSEVFSCNVCNVKKLNFDLIRRPGKQTSYFCSIPCLSIRLNEEQTVCSEDLIARLPKRLSTETLVELGDDSDDEDSNPDIETTEEVVLDKARKCKRKRVSKFMKNWSVTTTDEKSVQTNAREGFFHNRVNSATHCIPISHDKSSQTSRIDFNDLILTPFPVHVPTPVGMDAQFQIIPIFSPVPVPIPFPLLKKSKKRKICSLKSSYGEEKENNKLTFLEVAKQFMLNNDKNKSDADLSTKENNEKTSTQIEEIENTSLIGEEKLEKDEKQKTPPLSPLVEEKMEKHEKRNTSPFSQVKENKTEKHDKSNASLLVVEKADKDNASGRSNILEAENILKLNDDSEEDMFSILDINIANAWSPDSDIFEIDITSPVPAETTFMKKNHSETCSKISENEEAQFLFQLFSKCEISSTTTAIRESVGKKIWEKYITEKSKGEEFTSKVTSKSTNVRKLSKMDRCSLIVAFITNVLQLNDLHPHLVVYALLCVQKYFTSHSIYDSVFTCFAFQRAANLFFTFLQNYLDTFSSVNSFIDFSRNLHCVKIREQMLWDSKQLGYETPCTLLFSVLYFNTKTFGLHSYEEHENASPKDFNRFSNTKLLKDGTPIRLKHVRFTPSTKQPKKKYPEAVEDYINVQKCPVRLLELYMSKCPYEAWSSSNFYFSPIIGCSPDSKIWFTTRSVPAESLSNMLNLTRIVQEVQDVLYQKP